ncbi:phage protein NinX family protein [Moellerella wisconsensis]|uniref:Phage protein n=1 Tax=Moellerella wisconsensis ATCC 35017 TaxID=1354267 RepID=A0A0N1KI37_9GAMM|nr:phage protein NinX family protein [Moellerella wisconsensis]KPD01998.1 hypothetical protein M992_2541 [Moellerella wisconsensis ATCC 35017]VFS54205.1 Protein of uncharacterised function (DUF2591) [Moellerella wisconsensis]
MNKYTELSDFEINEKIAEKLRLDYWGAEPNIYVDDYVYSPCTNPIQAMPIIIENGISMVRVNNTWSARQFNNHCIEIIGDNYYRIAMEVYLLMNGK